jgi:DNA-binding PucR family transcriptional regulator
MSGHSVAVGISRPCTDPGDLVRAAAEATLAVNVAEGEPERPPLAFEQTGAYRLLLPAMADDPEELHRFYGETVQPLVAYDEQYETDHRHTVRYRLERVKELSGLDVGSSDGREKLSLGLKAMRVLGISRRGGPATEAGAGGGRIPGRG